MHATCPAHFILLIFGEEYKFNPSHQNLHLTIHINSSPSHLSTMCCTLTPKCQDHRQWPESILNGFDNDILQTVLPDFWALSIVSYSEINTMCWELDVPVFMQKR